MAFDIRKYADDVAKKKAFKSGTRFSDGKYVLIFKGGEAAEGSDPKRKGAVWLTANFAIESSKPVFIDSKLLNKGEVLANIVNNPENTSASVTADMNGEYSIGGIQQMAAALAGIDGYDENNADHAKKVSDTIFEISQGKASPLVGRKVAMESFRKEKRTKPGEIFCGFNWSPLKNDPTEQAALRAAVLEGTI
jgi:hypothetical protein